MNYLQPYAQTHLSGAVDPYTGLDQVGFLSPVDLARAGIQRARANYRARQYARQHGVISGYDYPDDDGDHLGADDLDELQRNDAELAGLDDDDDDDDDDVLGARPERQLRKLGRKLKRANRAVKRIKAQLSRVLPFRKKKRARLEDQLAEAQAKRDEIKDEIAAFSGQQISRPAVRAATPEETRMVTTGVPNPGQALRSAGVFAAAPGPGQQIELPITFDSSGNQLWEATIAAATTAGTQAAFAGETSTYTYLELQVVGLKVQCFMNAPLMTDGGATPLGIAITEQSAQCSVVMNNATVDGGLNMLPDDQIMNVGGPFGLSSEKLFDGLRLQDVIFENGKCSIGGFLEVAFDAAQAYDLSMRAAVIAVIIRDKRLMRG